MIPSTQCMHRWLFWTSDMNKRFEVFHLTKLISRNIWFWIRMVQKLFYNLWAEGSRFNLADYWLSCSIYVGLTYFHAHLNIDHKVNRTRNTLWKKRKLTLTCKIFREINSYGSSIIFSKKKLISSNFSWKNVRVNFAIFALW